MLRVVYCHFAPISPAHARNWVYLCFQRSIWPTLTFGGRSWALRSSLLKGEKSTPKNPPTPINLTENSLRNSLPKLFLRASCSIQWKERGQIAQTAPKTVYANSSYWGLNCCSAGNLLRSTHFGALWRLFLRSLTPEPFPKNHLRLFFLKIPFFF